MTKENGALVAIDAEQYPAIVSGDSAMQMIRDNMAGEEVTPTDLIRIKVPTGGETEWRTTDGLTDALEGIIVHIGRRRAYWTDPNPTGDPPACSSADCFVGQGDPGGVCKDCPHNVFGTSIKDDGSPGRGKACKETKLVFLLRAGNVLPEVVVVPPGSLKALRIWQLNLGVPYWSIVARLGLVGAINRDNRPYAQVAPAKVGALPQEVAEKTLDYAQSLQTLFAATGMEKAEVYGETVEA